MAHAGKSGRRVVSTFIATAIAQETPEAASAQWRAVADQIRPKIPKLAAILDDAEPDLLASMTSRRSTGPSPQHQPDRALTALSSFQQGSSRRDGR
jgi:transposase-like protein